MAKSTSFRIVSGAGNSVWAGKMRATLCLLLSVAVVSANQTQDRRSKLPYIADALGNTLPPPSNLPATVGSPVNLLTPDRYEFYTFDESGELVKRLMTLEEIQAIVAAGEDTEGLVTFANDNQPTIAFNFSQPPYTKVHSVVTNVQNVLKAQMEAHKNKPPLRPTLDTPDVSDSWSLILPSIFGNTGLDITPDKTTGSYITPETDTIDLDQQFYDEESFSKEGNGQIITSSTETALGNDLQFTSSTPKSKLTEKTTTSTTTYRPPSTKSVSTTKSSFTTTVKPRPITSTNTIKPTITTTIKPRSTTTTTTTTKQRPTTTTTTTVRPKPSTSTTTTFKPRSTTTTTVKPRPTTTTTTTVRPRPTTTTTTTVKPRPTTTTTTTVKPRPTTTTTTTVKPRPTTTTTTTTTLPPISTTAEEDYLKSSPSAEAASEKIVVATDRLETESHYEQITERGDIQYERISTFIPVSTFTYLPDGTTKLPLQATKQDTTQFDGDQKNTLTSKSPTFTTLTFDSVSSVNDQELEKNNLTTITTQSISPSTSVTYTQSTSTEQSIKKIKGQQNDGTTKETTTTIESEPMGSLFDVAESFSQIASDLGGTYRPSSSSNDLMESTSNNGMKLESKENLDIDIPSEVENASKVEIDLNNSTDNYIKISTLDPHDKKVNTTTVSKENTNENIFNSPTTSSPLIGSITTLDPVLSESMGDLLSQVVNEGPDNKLDSENLSQNDDKTSTTQLPTVLTTEYKENVESTTEVDINGSSTPTSSEAPYSSTLNVIKDESYIKEKAPIENTELKENKENLVKDSTVNSTLSDDKSTLIISVSDINSDRKKDTFQLSNDNDKSTQFITEDTKSANSTLPSYKSETEQSPEDKNNDSNGSDKNSFDSDKIEEKEFVELKQNEKVAETKVPPKVEDFKKKIQKVNIDDKELGSDRNNSWKLIPTVSPTKIHDMKKNSKDKPKTDNIPVSNDKNIILDFSKENQGLELTTKDLSEDIAQFTILCNELAFRYWNDLVETMDTKRSFVFSPYAVTSMLAMMFMGAKGATSGEMNEILKLDDMVTFNPHFTLKNISDSIEMTPTSGVAVSAFIRELYSDRNKGKILTFYKERVQHFYNGHVEEVNFKLISDIIRRRTNLLVKRYTWGKILEFMKTNTIVMQPPLAAFSANIFETDCFGTSVDGRDGELYFVVSPNVRQRRLVPVPAVVYKNNFLAGYDPTLDATAAALGNINSIVSTIFVMPGQQGNIVHAEDLEELEKRLLGSDSTTTAWNRLLRTLLPRVGLELQIPRLSHKSTFNISSTLQRMGLKYLFDAEHADLGGLNGPSKDLYLSDMIQSNTFVTCGENVIGEQHHIEQYPELPKRRSARWVHGWDEPRDYQRAFHDPHDVGEAMHLPLHLRPRQARLPARNAQPARLKFDRPFLFFVRHNPSGMILYVGRYNPRLLP